MIMMIIMTAFDGVGNDGDDDDRLLSAFSSFEFSVLTSSGRNREHRDHTTTAKKLNSEVAVHSG